MTIRSQQTNPSRWLLLFLAALIAALAAILSGTTASASATGGAENRVGAISHTIEPLVGPPQHIAAGQRLRRDVPQAEVMVATGVAAEAGNALRVGKTVSTLGRTYENSGTYLADVADHYGINLRGTRTIWDHDLGPATKGLTRQVEGGWIIRINPGFVDEPDLANTIAHELSHARDFQKGLASSPEFGPTLSGNSLEEWIYGLR